MTLERRQIAFGRSTIEYGIERSGRRATVTVAVDPSAGVTVKAPPDTPAGRLDDIMKAKAPWVMQRLAEVRQLGPSPAPKEFVAGEGYSYLGRSYRLRIEHNRGARRPVATLQGAFLTVSLPASAPVQERPALVKRATVAWYRKQAERRLTERVALYAERAGLRPPAILVREQEKRWGSCSSKGELRFNWRVIMAPLSLVDYVVAHEVCHLVVRDHSARFWQLLATILPDYEERRARLRVEGLRFQF